MLWLGRQVISAGERGDKATQSESEEGKQEHRARIATESEARQEPQRPQYPSESQSQPATRWIHPQPLPAPRGASEANGQGRRPAGVRGGEARDSNAHGGEARDSNAHDGEARDSNAHDGEARGSNAHDGEARGSNAHNGEARGSNAHDGEAPSNSRDLPSAPAPVGSERAGRVLAAEGDGDAPTARASVAAATSTRAKAAGGAGQCCDEARTPPLEAVRARNQAAAPVSTQAGRCRAETERQRGASLGEESLFLSERPVVRLRADDVRPDVGRPLRQRGMSFDSYARARARARQLPPSDRASSPPERAPERARTAPERMRFSEGKPQLLELVTPRGMWL